MTINVGAAINTDTSIILTVIRLTGGAYVDGLWVKGVETTFKTLGSPQQPSPKQLLVLPEEERTSDVMLFITNKPVRTLDDRTTPATEADIILFKGKRYRVIQLGDWDTFGQTHAFGIAEQQNDS